MPVNDQSKDTKSLFEDEEKSDFDIPKAPPPQNSQSIRNRDIKTNESDADSSQSLANVEYSSVNEAVDTNTRQKSDEDNTENKTADGKQQSLEILICSILVISVIISASLNFKSDKKYTNNLNSESNQKKSSYQQNNSVEDNNHVNKYSDLKEIIESLENELCDTKEELKKARDLVGKIRNSNALLEEKKIESEKDFILKSSNFQAKIDEISQKNIKLEQEKNDLITLVEKLKFENSSEENLQSENLTNAEDLGNILLTNKVCRVVNVLEGDLLNIRKGPSSSHDIVIGIINGSHILITGNAQVNGSDLWYPCSMNVKRKNLYSAAVEEFLLQGWVNSKYIQLVK